MAPGLEHGAGRDRGAIRNSTGVVRASDFPAADGNRSSGEIVKFDEFVGSAIGPAHAKLADHDVRRDCLHARRKTQKDHESENGERSEEHTSELKSRFGI